MGPVRSLKTAQNRLLFGGGFVEMTRDGNPKKVRSRLERNLWSPYLRENFKTGENERPQCSERVPDTLDRQHSINARNRNADTTGTCVCVYNINIHNCVSRPPPRFILKLVSVKCGRTRMKRVCNATDNITPRITTCAYKQYYFTSVIVVRSRRM